MISFSVILSTFSLDDLESGYFGQFLFFLICKGMICIKWSEILHINQVQRVGVNVTKYDNVITKATITKLK